MTRIAEVCYRSTMNPSRTAQTIQPFLVMDVMEKANTMAAGGRDIIHLEVGEPDFDTPGCIRNASIAAMERRRHIRVHVGAAEMNVIVTAAGDHNYGRDLVPVIRLRDVVDVREVQLGHDADHSRIAVKGFAESDVHSIGVRRTHDD